MIVYDCGFWDIDAGVVVRFVSEFPQVTLFSWSNISLASISSEKARVNVWNENKISWNTLTVKTDILFTVTLSGGGVKRRDRLRSTRHLQRGVVPLFGDGYLLYTANGTSFHSFFILSIVTMMFEQISSQILQQPKVISAIRVLKDMENDVPHAIRVK